MSYISNISKTQKYTLFSLITAGSLYGLYKLYKYLSKNAGKLHITDGDNNKIEQVHSKNTNTNTNTKSVSIIEPPKNLIDEKAFIKALDRICDSVIYNLMIGYEVIREDYDKNMQKFRRQDDRIKDLTSTEFKIGCNKYI